MKIFNPHTGLMVLGITMIVLLANQGELMRRNDARYLNEGWTSSYQMSNCTIQTAAGTNELRGYPFASQATYGCHVNENPRATLFNQLLWSLPGTAVVGLGLVTFIRSYWSTR